MATEYIEFIDCTTLSISYDIMGIATVSYNLIRNRPGVKAWHPLYYGGQKFEGYISSVNMQPIVGTDGWYENHVTLITTTN